MIRISLIAILCLVPASASVAQGVVWNPNSPRGARENRVNPVPPAPPPGQAETIEPQRWGTTTGTVGQPNWGTVGGAGWTGVTSPPAPGQ
jgi:hypothetical protein